MRWEANYSGRSTGVNFHLIELTGGSGTFEVVAGASLISNVVGSAIFCQAANATVNTSGGVVSTVDGEVSRAVMISNGSAFKMDAGTVSAAEGNAISVFGSARQCYDKRRFCIRLRHSHYGK